MMLLLRLAASCLAVILLTGTPVYARTPLKVHVSILPQKCFVEKTAGKDPHIWMSPLLVKHQAGIILETLRELDPDNAAGYNENYLRPRC